MANRRDIPVGRDNAISRAELGHFWDMDEREVRRTIARLRAEAGDDGYAILSTARGGSGYWRSNDPDEIRGFIAETSARARNTFVSIRDAQRVLKRIENNRDYGRRLDG